METFIVRRANEINQDHFRPAIELPVSTLFKPRQKQPKTVKLPSNLLTSFMWDFINCGIWLKQLWGKGVI